MVWTNATILLAYVSNKDPYLPSSGVSRSISKTNTSTVTNNSSSCKSSIDSRLPIPRSESEILSSSHLKVFSFNELRNATINFRPDSLLGEGGFGYVFKGWINERTLSATKPGSGITIAVKKLKPEGLQGHKEWLTELNYLGQLHHPNLFKLFGYCLEGGPTQISWAIRIKVAIDAARGLSFLHDANNQVIYRDLKAANILLDAEFNAKLFDFGLAKAGPTGDRTHVSTQVMGTHGYAAPDYVAMVDFDHSGKYLATGGACMISVYKIAAGSDPVTTFSHMSGRGDLSCIKFDKDAKYVAVARKLDF